MKPDMKAKAEVPEEEEKQKKKPSHDSYALFVKRILKKVRP